MNIGRLVDRIFDAVGRYWHAPAPAERLGMLRILTGMFATGYLLVRIRHFADFSTYAPGDFRPVGVVSLLEAPLPGATTWAVAALAIVAGAAFTAGFRYRVSAPLFAALFLWVMTYRNCWGMIFHSENLLVLHTLALALAPSATDALSVDARRRKRPSAHGRYGWPIRLMCALTAATYVVAGIAKLENTGLAWMTSDFLRNYVAYDAIRKIELGSIHSPIGGWLAERHPGAFKPAAALSLIVEVGAPLALVHRRIAPVWVGCAVVFHLGVLSIMAIMFPYVVLLFGFASFFRVERLAAWVSARLPAMAREVTKSKSHENETA